MQKKSPLRSTLLNAAGIIALSCAFFFPTFAQMQVEKLNRGLIAVRTGSGHYLSWRLLANEPYGTGFNVYRGSTLLNTAGPITGATIYTDNNTGTNNVYTVRAVVNGVERAASENAMIITGTQGNNAGYLQINLQRPPTGTHGGTYSPGDASAADLDGDGVYEIILKWDPSNQKDNSQAGITDNVFIDAYKLNGDLMWRIDLGPNIRAGAHYTQFMVYDFDGDGKAEMIVKTAEGTREGTSNVNTPGAYIRMGPAANGTHTAVRRNGDGYILSGAEYITVFDGQTGKELATADYWPVRAPINGWGNNESYGNRVDRFNAVVAYLDGERPTAVFQRGYYDRMTFAAWDWRDGRLTRRWTFDSNTSGNGDYAGQGNHQLSVADVDNSGRHSVITGAAVIKYDGTGHNTTRMGHGDALHVAHMEKNNPIPQIFMVHENRVDGLTLRNANGSTIKTRVPSGDDVGRGVAAELDPARPGFKMWASRPSGDLLNLDGTRAGNRPSSINHVIWWDGELSRELLDSNIVTKWSIANNRGTELLVASGYHAINGTKKNPVLQADLFGDWREEVIFSNGSNAIRIYTTTMPTTHRLVTLMHDPAYRAAVAWQNSSYNQPPHPGYYIASDMDFPPPALNVAVVGGDIPIEYEACAREGQECTEVVKGQCEIMGGIVVEKCLVPELWNCVLLSNTEYIETVCNISTADVLDWDLNTNLRTGDKAFVDRAFTIGTLPEKLQGAEWVSTAMDMKSLTSPAKIGYVEIKKDGVMYILYEDRVPEIPAWLADAGFQSNGMTVTVSESESVSRAFTVYAKNVEAGEIVPLGPNTYNGFNTCHMYLIAVTGSETSTSIHRGSAAPKYAMNVTHAGRGAFWVNYALGGDAGVRIDLFDIKGNRVRTIVNASKNAGVYREHVSANGLAAGIYVVQLRAGSQILRRRVTVAK